MSGIFFYSTSEDHLKGVDVNLDSAICYVDVECNDMEVKTEILENGFSEEMDQDMCDTKIPKESQSDGESCPVGLQKAALLYPVWGRAQSTARAVDVGVCCAKRLILCDCSEFEL